MLDGILLYAGMGLSLQTPNIDVAKCLRVCDLASDRTRWKLPFNTYACIKHNKIKLFKSHKIKYYYL